MSNIEVTLTSNIDEVENALEENIKLALEEVGLRAVGDAQLELESDPARVDTGLLRNSIAYAIAGEQPSIGAYQNNGKDKHGNPVPIVKGTYKAKMPKTEGEHAVYIGTNVEYAVYVHEGAHLPNGGSMEANRFLRNAIQNNIKEYQKIFDKGMRGKL